MVDELLDLLVSGEPLEPERLRNAGAWVAIAVGGRPADFWISSGGRARPGSVLAIAESRGEAVEPTVWLAMLRERLLAITSTGIDATFLVRGLVHYVTDWYRLAADTGSTADNRARLRQELYDRANSTDDDDQAARLRRSGDRLAPFEVDEVAERWAVLALWEQQATTLLYDD